MTYIETPEQRWGNRDYPYHLTGEVQESEYLKRLNPIDRSYLTILLQHIKFAARSMNTSTYALGVGSSANLQLPEYLDIDLLVCTDKPNLRADFVESVFQQIAHDPNFLITREPPKGSAPLSKEPYAPFKLFAFPIGPQNLSRYFKQFDLTFIGKDGGTFDQAVAFHRLTKLAFAQLTI